jgi:hypothetical protein
VVDTNVRNQSSTHYSGDDLSGWWATVQENIRRSEYHITWQEKTYLPDVPAAYQAPNRANNLRSYFTSNGPIVIPRVWPEDADRAPWRWELSLTAWGRGQVLVPVPAAVIGVEENLIQYWRGQLVEWYRNDEEGLEQGLTLLRPPQAGTPEEPLRLELHLGGDLRPRLDDARDEIEFFAGNGAIRDEPVLRYGALRVKDAADRRLPAWLSILGAGQDAGTLVLSIDDSGATYPIQVDPTVTGLPTDDYWSTGLDPDDHADSEFGFSVATAGDVNKDGYSEVIVGARFFDGGQLNEGKAFVFYGSHVGLWAIGYWEKEIDDPGAEFGYSVATAGDVNGDYRADVIIGAPKYSNGQEEEGGIWIYHGTETGLSSTHSTHKEGNQAHAGFGTSVATAGDVNGDWKADIIVGAPYYTGGQTGEGRVYVWHGSSVTGIPTGAAHWTAETNQDHGHMGSSVATAGDVNGDGYSDIIVGATGYADAITNEGGAFVWHGSGSGVNGNVDGYPDNAEWVVDGDQLDGYLGQSVSTAGDVNGDGYADVIVGAHLFNQGETDEGAVWLYLGSDSGLQTTSGNFDQGNQAGAWFGYSVATAGDVNGDGFADVIVGAPLYTSDSNEEGRAWVWHGSPHGISEARDWYADGQHEEAWFGTSVATAGDVNGDGYSDIIIGAPGDLSRAGTVYVYHGAPSGVAETAGWTKRSNKEGAQYGFSVGTAGDVNGDGFADIIVGAPRYDQGQLFEGGAWVYLGGEGGLNTTPAFDKFSDKVNAQFGYSVGTAGDVNGDGYADVIIGAPTYATGQTDEGLAFVYEGSAGGLDETPDWSKDSDHAGAQFGTSVGTAGDVDGDGYADVVVGAPFYTEDGHAFVYLGSASGLATAPAWHDDCDGPDSEFGHAVGTAGDVNRDGYSDVIVGAPKWENGDINEGGAFVYLGSRFGLFIDWVWSADGDQFDAQFGHSVGTAGDVDGDGYSDIIIGAPHVTNYETLEGRAEVYYGASTGIEAADPWRKESDQGSAQFGWSVATAGDVNGDGYADVIVGAHLWDGGQTGEGNEGGAWIYHGGPSGPSVAPDWHAEGNEDHAWFGHSVGSAGDVNGDGYADVIVGAPNYTQVITGEGQAFVYYGNGGSGVALALRQMHYETYDPLAHLGHSETNRFRIGSLTTNPFGRGLMQFQLEIKPLGQRFNGEDIQALAGGGWYSGPIRALYRPWTDLLEPDTPYHWRMRTRYLPANQPFMPASRWVTVPWNGWNEQDLRTGGQRAFVPLAARDYEY